MIRFPRFPAVSTLLLVAAAAFGPWPGAAAAGPADGSWSVVAPPRARFGAAMVYDSARRRVIVFGGSDAEDNLGDTWAVKLGPEVAWTLVAPAGSGPSGRQGARAVYDARRDRVLVYGGYHDGSFSGELWELALGGGAPAWRRLATFAPPPGRAYHAMALDPDSDRVYVYGGFDGALRGDAWVLSLASLSWSPLSAAGSSPGRRWRHTLIYDGAQRRLVLFGGSNGAYLNDVWSLKLEGAPVWSPMVTTGTPPSPRYGHTAVLDPATDEMIVCGGFYNNAYMNDVWKLSLADGSWTALQLAGAPPGRLDHAAVFDPVRDRMVVFGGYNPVQTYFNDLWELTLGGPVAWERRQRSGAPTGRYRHVAAYDGMDDLFVTYGGYADVFPSQVLRSDAWISRFATPADWYSFVGLVSPGPLRDQCAAFDSKRRRLLMYGGFDSQNLHTELWALSLQDIPSWTLLAASGGPLGPTVDAAAIYDPVRDRMVVFGGGYNGDRDETWEVTLAGSPAWHQLPTGKPGGLGRESPEAAYDPIRDRLVIFGGLRAGAPLNDVWALPFSGADAYHWSRIEPAGSLPPARFLPSMVYDARRDRLVVYGGADADGYENDVWALSLSDPSAWVRLAPSGLTLPGRFGQRAVYDATRDRMLVFGGIDADQRLARDVISLSWGFQGVPLATPGDAREAFALSASPNPARGAVSFRFRLPAAGEARLEVVDLEGRLVRRLTSGPLSAGAHELRWDGRGASGRPAPPGLYFYALHAAGERAGGRLVLLR